jgi:hypothetical protein
MNSEIAPAGKFRVGMNGNNGTLTIKNLEQAGAKGVRVAP